MSVEQFPDHISQFPFLNSVPHIISIVGAGGKTTLLYALAEEYKKAGRSVVITTTTHIYQPLGIRICHTKEELQQELCTNKIAVVGRETRNGKLTQSGNLTPLQCSEMADIVLIEADGAKGHPIKVPASHEPVVLPESDIVLAVGGMNALNQPLDQVCFRLTEAMQRLGTDWKSHCLTKENMAAIISSSWGGRKNVGDRDFYVVLNQCDTRERRKEAAAVGELIHNVPRKNIYLVRLRSEDRF